MSTTSRGSDQPSGQVGGAEPPSIPVAPRAEEVTAFGRLDWEALAREVWGVLERLAAEVRVLRPDIRCQFGNTRGRGDWTFLHATFDLPADHGIDAVVAGVLFELSANGRQVTIRADLAGEESGQVFFRVAPQQTETDPVRVLAAARTAAEALAGQAELVAANLIQPSFPPDEGDS